MMDGTSSVTSEPESATAPAVHLRFDTAPLKLGGWAAPVDAAHADDELILMLMIGSICLGKIRRDKARPDVDKHIGYSGPPVGFEVPDYGLRLFARLNGIEDVAILHDTGGTTVRHPIAMEAQEFRPLHIRHGIGKGLRLADIWLESSRGLVLRFEGSAGAQKWLDAYQAVPGNSLVCVAADREVGGHVALADISLLNPFAPLLLVFKGEDGAIEAIDVLPFPSLVRGGLHAAERLISAHGGDDLADTATVSAELVDRWAQRLDSTGVAISTIDLDPAVHTGMEPCLNPDLLAWLATGLGVSVTSSADLPSFIADTIERYQPQEPRRGPTLRLPADCIPTLSVLLRSFPDDAASQVIGGAMGIVDWNRHGRVWSVWLPPGAAKFEKLQPKAAQRFAPTLSISGVSGSGREVAIDFPLALALREQPTRVVSSGPFELPPEAPGVLQLPAAGMRAVDVVVLQSASSPLPLLESLARQENVEVKTIRLCRVEGEKAARVDQAAKRLLGGNHQIVPVAAKVGRIEQVVAAREHLADGIAVIVDGATILPDPRTLATLVQILESGGAASAGCLLRTGGDKMIPLSAGYSFTQFRLDSSPAAAFAVIDPAVWRQPCTYPVVANTLSVLATTAAALADLQPGGSSSSRPEIDDLLLGLHLARHGGTNLCTTTVSAHTSGPAPRSSQLSTTLPYRLAPEDLARALESSTLVQRIA